MNSRTMMPLATAPPLRSRSRMSSSRFLSACFCVLASTVWKVQICSPVSGSLWESVISHLSESRRRRIPRVV